MKREKKRKKKLTEIKKKTQPLLSLPFLFPTFSSSQNKKNNRTHVYLLV